MARTGTVRSDGEILLHEWGLWVRSGATNPRYQSPAWMMVRDNVGAVVRNSMIEDETAMLLDGLVARLGQTDAQAAKALMLYFPGGMNYRAVAKELQVGRETAGHIIRNAIAWINGALVGISA